MHQKPHFQLYIDGSWTEGGTRASDELAKPCDGQGLVQFRLRRAGRREPRRFCGASVT